MNANQGARAGTELLPGEDAQSDEDRQDREVGDDRRRREELDRGALGEGLPHADEDVEIEGGRGA